MDYLLAMGEGRVVRHQLDRCRDNNNNNNNMGELEELDELSSDEYDYEDYRYDYSDEEYSEENYDNDEEEEEKGGLLVEANAIPAVYNTWNPLRGESEILEGGNTQVVAGNTQAAGGKAQVVNGNVQVAGVNIQVSGENNVNLGDNRNKDWEARQNVGTGSHVRVEANDDATLPQKEEKSEKLSQQVKSEKVLMKKSSEYNIWDENKSEKEKIYKDDNWERKTKEKRKSEESDQLSSSSKDDFWEEDGGGFLDLGGGGGEKSEKWGQELFVRSSQSRFEPFCTLILISSLIFNSFNT